MQPVNRIVHRHKPLIRREGRDCWPDGPRWVCSLYPYLVASGEDYGVSKDSPKEAFDKWMEKAQKRFSVTSGNPSSADVARFIRLRTAYRSLPHNARYRDQVALADSYLTEA